MVEAGAAQEAGDGPGGKLHLGRQVVEDRRAFKAIRNHLQAGREKSQSGRALRQRRPLRAEEAPDFVVKSNEAVRSAILYHRVRGWGPNVRDNQRRVPGRDSQPGLRTSREHVVAPSG